VNVTALLCAISFTVGITCERADAATKPLINMEAALAYSRPNVRDLEWVGGDARLVGSWRETQSGKNVIVIWDIHSGHTEPSRMAAFRRFPRTIVVTVSH